MKQTNAKQEEWISGNNPLPMDRIWVQEVIIATVVRRGKGNVEHDPIRIITQVFLKDGTLIAEFDPTSITK